MSDPMEDLRAAITDRILRGMVGSRFARKVTDDIFRAISAAGYRIVKPDCAHGGEFALYCDEDGEGDDICQVAGSYGPRDMAIAEILNAARNYAPDEIEIEEIIRVPVDPAELLAELESMKEAGE